MSTVVSDLMMTVTTIIIDRCCTDFRHQRKTNRAVDFLWSEVVCIIRVSASQVVHYKLVPLSLKIVPFLIFSRLLTSFYISNIFLGSCIRNFRFLVRVSFVNSQINEVMTSATYFRLKSHMLLSIILRK